MGDERLLAEVREWLERGGYVLEMQVALQMFFRGTSRVTQGYHYTDPVTGIEREGDISCVFDAGEWNDNEHRLQVLVECKNTQAPWVFFVGSRDDQWTPTLYWDPDNDCPVCGIIAQDLDELLRRAPQAYAITEKRKNNAQQRDLAYEAVQQITSAVVALFDDDGDPGHDEPEVVSYAALPVVVTNSPLISCRLDLDGEPLLQETSRVVVSVPRIHLPDPFATGLQVMVVRASALESLLDDIDKVGSGHDWPDMVPGEFLM